MYIESQLTRWSFGSKLTPMHRFRCTFQEKLNGEKDIKIHIKEKRAQGRA